MVKLTNKWRVSARVTPEMNRALNDLLDRLKESDSLKVRGRSVRREHLVQLALLGLIKLPPEEVAKVLTPLVEELEAVCE